MTVKLKRLVGEAGAGLDSSVLGADRLYDVLNALVDSHVDLVTQFNQLKADVLAASAFPITTTATSLVKKVELE
jgi:hypothetical protein